MIEARQLTRAVNLSHAEFTFVLSQSQLDELEKIIWLLIAAHAENVPLVAIFSYVQISHIVDIDYNNVHQAIQRLMAMGYLDIDALPDDFTPLKMLAFRKFFPLLPPQGLLALKKAPKCQPHDPWHNKGIYKRPEVLINLLNNRLG